MSSNKFDIEKVAFLARLKLTADEKIRLGGQFEGILAHIDQLDRLDTSTVEPTTHVLPLQNVFREDVLKKNFPDVEYLALAPAQDKGHYKVPQII